MGPVRFLRKDNVSIQTLHTDNDSVFKDKKFGATCSHASIHINFSAPGDQWQNGCAESFVGRCKFLGSAALAAANLGEEYTVFAMLNAAHVGNFLPNTLHPECPLDRWTGKVNNHAHLRTFGSECYVYDAGHQGLQPRSLKALYLGDASHVGQGSYSRGTYRVQVLSTGKQRTSRHVLFDETVVPDCPRATERALRLHDEWVQALKHDPHAWDDPTQPATDSSVELPAPMDDQSSEPEPNTATITPVSSTPARIDLTVDNATLVDSIRNAGRVLAKGPRLKNAKAYIATRSLAVCGMKVDEALQHQYRNNKGAKANYRISDLAYDIKRQHLVTLDTQQVAVLQAFAPDHSKDLLTAEDHKAIKSVHEMYPGMPVRVDMEGELYEFREARLVHKTHVARTGDNPTFAQAMRGEEREDWIAAIEKEYNGLVASGTWTLVKLPSDQTALPSQLVLKKKKDRFGKTESLKARCVISGQHCKGFDKLTQLFCPVGQTTTFRCMIACAAQFGLEVCQLDFCQAFLQATCPTPTYVKQGVGQQKQLDENGMPLCYRVDKAQYGLPFAPKAWHDTIHPWLIQFGFTRSQSDSCLYTYEHGETRMDLLLYVDDCCITFDKATSAEIYQKFLKDLSATFKYTGGGAAEHFLGFGISRDRELGQIQLDQHGFVEQMLADYNVKKDVTQLIPAAAGNLLGMNLCPPPGPEGDDEREYMRTRKFRAVIGSLLWLSRGSRPDLAWITGMLSRVLHNPGRLHWFAARVALQYVATTRNQKLTYRRSANGYILSSSVDADFLPAYGNQYDNWKSTTGWVCRFAGGAVSWRSRRQDTVATSTPHAECLAAFDCSREVLHLRELLHDLGAIQRAPTILEEDNQSLIRITLNTGGEADRIKHWDYKVHWLREQIQKGSISFAWVATVDQMADSFTKPLPRPALEAQRDHNMGIKPLTYTIHDKIFRDNADKFATKQPLAVNYLAHYTMIRTKSSS
jgi:hypothetical protein